MKNISNKFFEKPHNKLLLVILLTLLIITISVILFSEVGLDEAMIIYGIFGSLSLASLLDSFYSSKKRLFSDLSLGISRKAFYTKYIKNIFYVFLISLFILVFYIFIYKLIIGPFILNIEPFSPAVLTFLPILFISLSFLGFFLGMMNLDKYLFYIFTFIISIIIILGIIYLKITYIYSLILIIMSIVFGVTNSVLIKKIEL